jgi:hypothetical protein
MGIPLMRGYSSVRGYPLPSAPLSLTGAFATHQGPSMSSAKKLTNINRLDVAKRQLATAIKLYLSEDDPVSIHTLASAAAELLDRIAGRTSIRNDLLARAEAVGRRREISDKLNRAKTFFKHGATDPNETLAEFSDDQNLYLIVQACYALHIVGDSIPEAQIFTSWLSVIEPELFVSPPNQEMIFGVFGDIRSASRDEQKRIGFDALHLKLTGRLP